MSVKLSNEILREQESADTRATIEIRGAASERAQSSDVAEVANRPKKRPGRRLRSSITIRATSRQAMLV